MWKQRIENRRNRETKRLERKTGVCPYCHCEIETVIVDRIIGNRYIDEMEIYSNGELYFVQELDSVTPYYENIEEFRCPECDRILTKPEVEEIFGVRLEV